MAGNADLLSIVEAAYFLDSPTDRWNLGLVRAAHAALTGELGGFAALFHIDDRGTLDFDMGSTAALGVPDACSRASSPVCEAYRRVG